MTEETRLTNLARNHHSPFRNSSAHIERSLYPLRFWNLAPFNLLHLLEHATSKKPRTLQDFESQILLGASKEGKVHFDPQTPATCGVSFPWPY